MLFDIRATLSYVKPRVTKSLTFDGKFDLKAQKIGTIGKEQIKSTGVHLDVTIMINGEVL